MRSSRMRVCCHPNKTPIKRVPTDAPMEGTPEELDAIRLHLEKIDKLLGGLVLKIGSRMIDSSLRTKLDGLRAAMRGS